MNFVRNKQTRRSDLTSDLKCMAQTCLDRFGLFLGQFITLSLLLVGMVERKKQRTYLYIAAGKNRLMGFFSILGFLKFRSTLLVSWRKTSCSLY